MNISMKTIPSEAGQIVLDTLKTAVTNALERKKRLGQYAVIWKNGKVVKLDANAIETDQMQ